MPPTEGERDTVWPMAFRSALGGSWGYLNVRHRYNCVCFQNSFLPLLKRLAGKLGFLFNGNLVFCHEHCENGYALRFKKSTTRTRQFRNSNWWKQGITNFRPMHARGPAFDSSRWHAVNDEEGLPVLNGMNASRGQSGFKKRDGLNAWGSSQ